MKVADQYKRDPQYGRSMAWGPLYARHFPERTDPSSRHSKIIAESLRDIHSPMRKMLCDAGYEPDHMASSIEITVKMLWEARAEIERCGGNPFPHIKAAKPKPTRTGD